MVEEGMDMRSLCDRDLLAELARAAASERRATARLVALLVEMDTRRLYLGEGFSSLFTYCTEALHLSEHAAYTRIEAARAARRFPIILALIDEGAVTLTAVRRLAPHLTGENYHEVLARARHQNTREVERLVASLHPQPDVPALVRKLPTCAVAVTPVLPPAAAESDSQPVAAPRTPKPAALTPLAPERYKIQFTASRETYDKLRRAQALLRHAVPDGDPAAIVDRALTLLVAQLERRKTGAAGRPRSGRVAIPGTRHIPAAVRRAVWQRDGGRCAFVGTHGRCTETGFLEYHHVVPFAEGGETSTANISLRCRAHNAHETREYFGPAPPLFEQDGPTEGQEVRRSG
jgi:hypothetical protein